MVCRQKFWRGRVGDVPIMPEQRSVTRRTVSHTRKGADDVFWADVGVCKLRPAGITATELMLLRIRVGKDRETRKDEFLFLGVRDR